MKNKSYSPVIIIGMHRSGTSLVAGLLHRLGIFMGHRRDDNEESVFFQRLNQWLFSQAGAAWDNPYNFRFIDRHFKEHALMVIERHLRGIQRLNYLGLKKFFKYSDIRHIDFPWGWKDPRNTFTIEVWKEIFPYPWIIHVFRNPVDVARSLETRESKLRRRFRLTLKDRIKEFLLRGKTYPNWSLRVLDIYEGIELWQEYTEKALSLNGEFGDRIIHVCYERFLENPEETLRGIAKFIGFDIPDDISDIIKSIKADRRFAFLNDMELVEIYRTIKDRQIVKKLGYEDIL